jgi:hypothetical protein
MGAYYKRWPEIQARAIWVVRQVKLGRSVENARREEDGRLAEVEAFSVMVSWT